MNNIKLRSQKNKRNFCNRSYISSEDQITELIYLFMHSLLLFKMYMKNNYRSNNYN